MKREAAAAVFIITIIAMRSVVMGLGGVNSDPDAGASPCLSTEQTQGLNTFKDIGKSAVMAAG